MTELVVCDEPAEQRYEAWVDGHLAGVLIYERDGGTVSLVHTEVEPQGEGQGIGSALARRALDDIRASGRRVVPLCPFVRAWIARHPDYADLVSRGAAPG